MSDQMDAAAPSRKPCPTLTPVFRHRKDTVAEKHHISDVELTPANVNVNTPELPRTQSKTKRNFEKVNDYSFTNVSKKVERIILSYTDYINHNVWRKEF